MPWTFTAPTTAQAQSWLLDSLRRLQTAFTFVEQLTFGRRVLEVGVGTPSVQGARLLLTANVAAINVTAFRDGYPGQHLTLIFNDANTTLVHGTNLQLAGGVNFTGAVGATRAFATYDGTVWYQVPRG